MSDDGRAEGAGHRRIAKHGLQEPRPPERSPLTAAAFWLCLLFAAGLYATVALSPKLLNCLRLKQRYETQHLQLVGLEQQIESMRQTVAALKSDAAYQRELARVDFRASLPDEQRIPVDGRLARPARPQLPDLKVAAPDLPWYTPLLQIVAEAPHLGTMLLLAAASITIYAFTCLSEPRAPSA